MHKESKSVPLVLKAMVAHSTEHSSTDRRTKVRSSAGRTPLCTLMAPGACKIWRGCDVLQVPIQIIPLEVLKRGSYPLRGGSKLQRYVS